MVSKTVKGARGGYQERGTPCADEEFEFDTDLFEC